jgi:hypothetical protein
MEPSRKRTTLVGAWLDARLIAGVDKWLKRHPKFDQTAFLLTAVDEKLRTASIVVPREIALNRKALLSSSGLNVKSNIAGEGNRGHNVKPNRLRTSPVNRANKIMIRARMDNALVGAIEHWLSLYPGYSRTDFLLEAVAAKLKRDGIVVKKDAIKKRETRWLLIPKAYTPTKSLNGFTQAQAYANKLEQHVDQMSLMRKKVESESAPAPQHGHEGATRPLIEQLNRISEKLKRDTVPMSGAA